MKPEHWDLANANKYLQPAKPDDHKYSRGVLTCISGSKKFPGAALLTTKSALATGVGMVRFLGSRQIKKLVLLNTPEVVISSGRVDAFLLGSGVPTKGAWLTHLRIKNALRSNLPTVLDAGGLQFVKYAHELTVLTPHAGELANLLSRNSIPVTPAEITSDPANWATIAAQKFNITVLLKGNTTFVANSNRVIQLAPAPPQLATAGTGDILAGIIGGLLAINREQIKPANLIEVAATGALVQTMAAEVAIRDSGNGPLDLANVINSISEVISVK